MSERVKVIEKGLLLLNVIGNSQEPLSLAEITKETGVPKTTTRRILSTLVDYNYLEYDANQKYKLGMQILKLGISMLNRNKIKTYAREYAKQLRDKTNLTVFVGVLDGFEIIYIEKVSANITMVADVGYRAPAYCTAIGQVFLSDLREEDLEKLLGNNELIARTDRTITDRTVLKEKLQEIKRQGYAIDEREHRDEIRCIAAPIKDHTGKTVAAISVSSVVSLYDENKMSEYINHVKETASQISERLGCQE